MMDWFVWTVALAFFGGMLIRWDQRMRENRRVILPILGRRGFSSAKDLEDAGRGTLHLPTLRITLRWVTEQTGEVEAVLPPGATHPLYRLTPKGAKTAEAIEKQQKRRVSPGRSP